MTDVIQKRHDTTWTLNLTADEYVLYARNWKYYVRWAERTHKDRGQLLRLVAKLYKKAT